jgi:hypothetical protein
MMTTDDEARTKWCPFAKVGAVNAGVNRILDSDAHNATWQEVDRAARCVGSYCMAWQWLDENIHYLGYCGLAGKP